MGVGAGKNPGRYEGAGLGARLDRCWRHEGGNTDDGDRIYVQGSGYEDVEGIVTIPLDPHPYLACGLEAYLIEELNPPKNIIGRTH